MDYNTLTIRTLNQLSFYSSIDNISWKTLDKHIQNAIHYIRLFHSFSDESKHFLYLWKSYMMNHINRYIVIRNSLVPINIIETTIPMGILLYLSDIQCPFIVNRNDFISMCVDCHSIIIENILSESNDIHAVWKCPRCRSVHLKGVTPTHIDVF